MKSFASVLLVGALALGLRTVSAQTDINRGTEPVGLFGHTPVPTPPKASGPKQPMGVTMALDEKGGGAATTFAKSNAKIYVLIKNPSGVKGDKVRAVWTAEDTGGVFSKGQKLNDSTQTVGGPGQITFFTQIAGGYPPGKYKTDVYVNSTLAKSVTFTVKK